MSATATKVTFSYRGPKRLEPTSAGLVQEVVEIGDFEGQLYPAIGLDRRRTPKVTRGGTTVTVTFDEAP